MIEGYTDPLYETLNKLDLFKGGDMTLNPTMALNALPTRPLDNIIALYQGGSESNYNTTRTYGKWMNQNNIIMNGTEYDTLSSVKDYSFSPWVEDVPLNGTDGIQFSP